MTPSTLTLILLASLLSLVRSQYVGSCGKEAAMEYAAASVRPASIKNDTMTFPHDEETAMQFCR